MKRSILFLTAILGGCASNSGTGMIAGGVLGASIGAISGGGGGALIGSSAGVIAGGFFGLTLDGQERKVMQESSPRTVDRMDRGESLTINDVIKLSQNGVSDDTIIQYMKDTQSSYQLSQPQVRRLQDAKVSARVINEMLAQGR